MIGFFFEPIPRESILLGVHRERGTLFVRCDSGTFVLLHNDVDGESSSLSFYEKKLCDSLRDISKKSKKVERERKRESNNFREIVSRTINYE